MAKTKEITVKRPANTPNVTYKEDGTIVLKNVFLSYPALFQPRAGKDKEGNPTPAKFKATGIMPLATHKQDIIVLKKYIEAIMMEQFERQIAPDNLCLRDGKFQAGEEYKGTWYVAASNTLERPPQLVDRNPNNAVKHEDNKLYAGAKVNIMIRLWPQNNDFGKKINANLLIVQFVEKSPAFGNVDQIDAAAALDDISGDFPDEDQDIGDEDLGDDDGLDDI